MFKVKALLLMLVLGFLLAVTGPVFAGGNKEVPDIPPITSGTQYISPNGDGVQDKATLDFSVKVYVKSKEGYLPEYGLQILDSSGNIMKEVRETEKSDIGWFASLFKGYSEFSLERSISWDGTDLDGGQAGDGTYNVKLWVVDSSKNRQETDVDDFVVDTVKPGAVIVSPENMVFSPNGDGSADTFKITHTQATEEVLWEASITDSRGNEVKAFTWENSEPGTAEWDGTDESGSLVDPGVYSYSLSAVDQAGNESDEIRLEGITLDMTVTDIDVVISNRSISPNGDGIKDSLTIYLDQAVKEGIETWEWQIRNPSGDIYWNKTGEAPVPEEISFDGKDSKGNPMPEGDYSFVYKVAYVNGNRPTASEDFSIDVTAPEISLSMNSPVFSPNGDGLKDSLQIQFKSDSKVEWEGSILNSEGQDVVSTSSDETTSLIVWDGINPGGDMAPDGEYSVVAVFTDEAGNMTWIDPAYFTIDRRASKISLKTEKGFSPDGDGVNDSMILLVDSNQYDYLDYWALEILDKNGETVRTIKGDDILPPEISWDGEIFSEDGEASVAEEGTYSARLSALYQKGDNLKVSSDSFVLDVTPPEIMVDVAADPFAASDAGIEGEVYVTVKVLDNSEINHWIMDVMNADGDILRSYSGSGDPSGDITWNSSESGGGSAISLDKPDFVLKLTVYDSGNNEADFVKAVPLDILLVIKDGKKYLSVPNIIFGAYKHALDSAGQEFLVSNNASLDKVYGIYQKYPGYGLTLEGHALNIYLDGPREDAEEKILLPLTQRRADTVKDALVSRGMESSRITTEAYGGQFPIASVTDSTVWWKNRRVEFVMTDPVK